MGIPGGQHLGATANTEHEGRLVGLTVLKTSLDDWYKEFDKRHPGEPCTRINVLSPKMVGIGGEKRLKTKAMETFHLCNFLVEFLPHLWTGWLRMAQCSWSLGGAF